MRLLPGDDEEKVSRFIGKSGALEWLAVDGAADGSAGMEAPQGVGYAISDEEGA